MPSTNTSIYLDEELLKTAKTLNINLSKVCARALQIEIGLPVEQEALEEELIRNRAREELLKDKLTTIKQNHEKKTQENTLSQFENHIRQLKAYKKKMIENKLPGPTYHAMIKRTAAAYGKSMEEILERVDGASLSLAMDGQDELDLERVEA